MHCPPPATLPPLFNTYTHTHETPFFPGNALPPLLLRRPLWKQKWRCVWATALVAHPSPREAPGQPSSFPLLCSRPPSCLLFACLPFCPPAALRRFAYVCLWTVPPNANNTHTHTNNHHFLVCIRFDGTLNASSSPHAPHPPPLPPHSPAHLFPPPIIWPRLYRRPYPKKLCL
jgi:hypothetical protein